MSDNFLLLGTIHGFNRFFLDSEVVNDLMTFAPCPCYPAVHGKLDFHSLGFQGLSFLAPFLVSGELTKVFNLILEDSNVNLVS